MCAAFTCSAHVWSSAAVGFGVEWLRCALRWLERCGRRCGERQSRARSMTKQCNILYIENIENNDSNAAASSLLGWATVNAWSVEQTIRRGETSQHHHKR